MKSIDETYHFYNRDLREFEKLNTTTDSIYELGDYDVLIILKDGENLTDYSDVENLEDIIYISEDLTGLLDAESYYYWGTVIRRHEHDDSAIPVRYCDNPLRNVKAIVCQGITCNVTSLDGMFRQLDSLTTVSGLETWDVDDVFRMSSMFCDCESLKRIHGLDVWDVGNVTDMAWMFRNCRMLEDISFLRSWDVSSVEIMKGMFMECMQLNKLEPLADWNMSGVMDLELMFFRCQRIYNLAHLGKWKISNAASVRGMFRDCTGLYNPGPAAFWHCADMEDMFLDTKIQPSNRCINTIRSISCVNCGGQNLSLDGDLVCLDCLNVVLKAKDMKCPECGSSEMEYGKMLYCSRCGLILFENSNWEI
jgi:surface protein